MSQTEEAAGTPVFFNAHHAPIGAFATFTLGAKGASGGFGLEIGGPANEEVFVGAQNDDGSYAALPFFNEGGLGFDQREFDVESLSGLGRAPKVRAFPDGTVSRRFGTSIDEWHAGDMTFRIVSPVRPVPDPDSSTADELRTALAPAVLAELTLDNRAGSRSRKAFFGYHGSNRTAAMRAWSHNRLLGIGQGEIAIGTHDPGVYAGAAFQPEAVLEPSDPENLRFMLGRVGLLVGEVPAGEIRTFRFAIGFFREGAVTTGLRSRYLYRRGFESLEEVLEFALDRFTDSVQTAEAFDRRIADQLSGERAWMLAHAIRSYYGSTQCLELEGGKPLWIVNEGEYRMMNTLDLMPDQAFFELAMNPWTVRSELDFYADRYAYRDEIAKPGEGARQPGGLAFTHDVGVANGFAEAGHSAYEQTGLTGCFSQMSCEELVNWMLCACLYGEAADDVDWLHSKAQILADGLDSLARRDDPDPNRRNGVMGWDSARCGDGAEITTYDSLDASLGQARGNVYLAVKTWAAYLLLERCLRRLDKEEEACFAARQAERCAETVAQSADESGRLPAILGSDVEARIIPAIEGLVFPLFLGFLDELRGASSHGRLIQVLERHLRSILKSGECVFDDGGWKLSSTSRNSWLSKIYLCQFVAERAFGLEPDQRADKAHVGWLTRPDNAYFAWSDQMLDGRAVGSRYYPRGVTAWLWADKTFDPKGTEAVASEEASC